MLSSAKAVPAHRANRAQLDGQVRAVRSFCATGATDVAVLPSSLPESACTAPVLRFSADDSGGYRPLRIARCPTDRGTSTSANGDRRCGEWREYDRPPHGHPGDTRVRSKSRWESRQRRRDRESAPPGAASAPADRSDGSKIVAPRLRISRGTGATPALTPVPAVRRGLARHSPILRGRESHSHSMLRNRTRARAW